MDKPWSNFFTKENIQMENKQCLFSESSVTSRLKHNEILLYILNRINKKFTSMPIANVREKKTSTLNSYTLLVGI